MSRQELAHPVVILTTACQNSDMAIEMTIALPEELLRTVDERATGFGGSRSRLIEAALRTFFGRAGAEDLDARDRALIERHLDELNAEAEDALEYQAPL